MILFTSDSQDYVLARLIYSSNKKTVVIKPPLPSNWHSRSRWPTFEFSQTDFTAFAKERGSGSADDSITTPTTLQSNIAARWNSFGYLIYYISYTSTTSWPHMNSRRMACSTVCTTWPMFTASKQQLQSRQGQGCSGCSRHQRCARRNHC
jgi:hypothetical protein